MQCACSGKGFDVTLCDFHARVFTARNNRLVVAANNLFEKVSSIAIAKPLVQPELDALSDSLNENGVSQLFNAGAESKRRAHGLLLRTFDLLVKETQSTVDRKELVELRKQRISLIEELRKIFNPKEKASNG